MAERSLTNRDGNSEAGSERTVADTRGQSLPARCAEDPHLGSGRGRAARRSPGNPRPGSDSCPALGAPPGPGPATLPGLLCLLTGAEKPQMPVTARE